MNMRADIRPALTLAACALLAACAVAPPKPRPTPAEVMARPEPPPPTVTPITPGVPRADPWASMVGSFVLHDCADSPPVRASEAMFTRWPTHFERLLQQSLPLILYVHARLQAAGLPGEFAMLPLLESAYDPHEPSRSGDAAGMWQLMPATARRRGIVVNHAYDGRLDPIASTGVAIGMLSEFDRRFGDWRLADMAYNAGPHAVAVALRKHPGLGGGPIPDIPVSAAARRHLAKLLALACILREPDRFHVQLPRASAGDQLATVTLPAGTRIADAADMAEIPETGLRALNPGYLGRTLPSDSPRTLLLPAGAAQSLAAALAVAASESVAQTNTTQGNGGSGGDIPLPREPGPPPTVTSTATPTPAARHRVHVGETLWSIARHYHVTVGDLKRWNHLRGDTIRTGENLQIED